MIHYLQKWRDGRRKVAQVYNRRKMWTQGVTVWQRSWRALRPSEHPVHEEREREGHLPFLHIDTYRRSDGCLGHQVYCKPNHTNPCLNSGSIEQAVLSTLVHKARGLHDCDALYHELEFHKGTVSRTATMTSRFVWLSVLLRRLLCLVRTLTQSPFCNIWGKSSIASAGCAGIQLHLLVKDDLWLMTLGVYNIPCRCGYMYTGYTFVDDTRAPSWFSFWSSGHVSHCGVHHQLDT